MFTNGKVLNERLMYLNRLRVDVGRTYVYATGAILALTTRFGGLSDAAILFKAAGIPLLTLGLAVLLFDIKNCARAGAVAIAIRENSGGGKPQSPPGLLGSLSEDACFGMTISALNSFVLVATVGAFWLGSFSGVETDPYKIVIGIAGFLAAFVIQTLIWVHWVGMWERQIDALPVGGANAKSGGDPTE